MTPSYPLQPTKGERVVVPDCDDCSSERAPDRVESDAELWSRVRSGDADAFGSLFERHGHAIYNYCFHRTGDWSTAEDLTSLVFLEALRRRSKDIPDGFVRAWFFGIATNVIRNARRSQRRHAAAMARLPREALTPSFADDAVSRLDDERTMGLIVAGLRRLPRREREVLALVVISQLSYEEAALALDVPLGTVRSRLSRAKRRLRELNRGSGHVDAELFEEGPER
jgi:RNA polymerase sigma-70 factor, ECF subfamily